MSFFCVYQIMWEVDRILYSISLLNFLMYMEDFSFIFCFCDVIGEYDEADMKNEAKIVLRNHVKAFLDFQKSKGWGFYMFRIGYAIDTLICFD